MAIVTGIVMGHFRMALVMAACELIAHRLKVLSRLPIKITALAAQASDGISPPSFLLKGRIKAHKLNIFVAKIGPFGTSLATSLVDPQIPQRSLRGLLLCSLSGN